VDAIREPAAPSLRRSNSENNSIDVEHDLAADVAAQESINSARGPAPGALEFDLTVQATVHDESAQPSEVIRRAVMACDLVVEIQCVDRRARRAIEAAGAEGHRFVGALRRDVHKHCAWSQVFDGHPEHGSTDAVENEVKAAIDLVDNIRGAQSNQ